MCYLLISKILGIKVLYIPLEDSLHVMFSHKVSCILFSEFLYFCHVLSWSSNIGFLRRSLRLSLFHFFSEHFPWLQISLLLMTLCFCVTKQFLFCVRLGSIKSLSPQLWGLTHLTSLFLNDNLLQRVPPDISRLQCLSLLDLSSNKVMFLHSFFVATAFNKFHLKKKKTFYVFYLHVTQI